MNNLNTVALVGRVVEDVKLQFSSRDNPYIFFSLAVNQNVKKADHYEDEASFIDCQLYGRSAEALEKYLKKGKLVSLDGRLKQNRWEKDGQKFSRLVVVVRELQLLGGGERAENGSEGWARQETEAQKFADDGIPF